MDRSLDNDLAALDATIRKRLTANHDYESSAQTLVDIVTEVYSLCCYYLDLTMFQASWADLQILRRNRQIDGPFGIYMIRDCLYPQYDVVGRVERDIRESADWLRAEAAKELEAHRDSDNVAPEVRKHWERLAGLGDAR